MPARIIDPPSSPRHADGRRLDAEAIGPQLDRYAGWGVWGAKSGPPMFIGRVMTDSSRISIVRPAATMPRRPAEMKAGV